MLEICSFFLHIPLSRYRYFTSHYKIRFNSDFAKKKIRFYVQKF